MITKLLLFGFVNILFFIPIFADENNEISVPPIQYPEKVTDEMQVRKEIKNSFFKNENLVAPSLEKNYTEKNINNNNYKKEQSPQINQQNNLEDIIDKSIQKKRNEIKSNNQINLTEQDFSGKSSETWKIFLISTLFISTISILGFLLIKMRRKGVFSISKADKIMDIISTMPISPKRQILILKIKDQEIVIANTENGINFLTEINNSTPLKNIIDKKQMQLNEKFLLPKNEKIEQNISNIDKPVEKKSDILLKALKSLNSNSLGQKKNNASDIDNSINSNSQNKAENFPKYLINQFENESKKELKKKDDEVDSVDNVTNLIREKLRSMKPLN